MLEVGDVLKPGAQVGKGRSPWIYLAGSPKEAMSWAKARAMREGKYETRSNEWAQRITVPLYVYEVEAEAQKTREGWRARQATVVALIAHRDHLGE